MKKDKVITIETKKLYIEFLDIEKIQGSTKTIIVKTDNENII